MRHVTSGTAPQREHTWKSAVAVPKRYFDTSALSLIATFSEPAGLEVHTPPCLMQNEQVHTRAGISVGSGSHASAKAMFWQWHEPLMSMLETSRPFRLGCALFEP